MIRVKLIHHYYDSKTACNFYNKQCKEHMTWENIEITSDDNNIDYYCLINYPRRNEKYIPEKTIYMTMEPLVHINSTNHFPIDWNKQNIQNKFFMYVLNRNNIEWWIDKTYYQLSTEQINKTKLISSITSDLYIQYGHKKRVDFLKFLENKDFKLDLFGRSNKFKLKNYKGELPGQIKDNGILPYKYTIACENSSELNYFTEKIVDAILGECLCFYWGCPNLSDYIDKMAYIQLDMNDFDKSFNIIVNAIETNEWEKRINIIQKEKYKILNELQFLPTLHKIINTLYV